MQAGAEPEESEEADTQGSEDAEAAELDAEIAQLAEAVAAARVRHRTLQRVQRMYTKRMPALQSDAERLSAISQSMVQASTQEGSSSAAAPSAPSGAPSLAELTSQAAEAVVLCGRLAEAAGTAGGADGKPASRGKARQSFGGVMSQFERDVKKLGGGQRTA